MVTEAKAPPTAEEMVEFNERMDRFEERLSRSITDGIGSTVVTEAQRRGITMIVESVFMAESPLVDANRFSEDGARWAQALAFELAHGKLLRKFIGVWYMEGAASNWKDVPDGILGKVLDQAADTIRPYLGDDITRGQVID